MRLWAVILRKKIAIHFLPIPERRRAGFVPWETGAESNPSRHPAQRYGDPQCNVKRPHSIQRYATRQSRKGASSSIRAEGVRGCRSSSHFRVGGRSPGAPKLSSQRIDSRLDNSSSIEIEGPTEVGRSSCSPTLSLEKSEGWGTQSLWVDQGWATRR
jgi:hypothetical protein